MNPGIWSPTQGNSRRADQRGPRPDHPAPPPTPQALTSHETLPNQSYTCTGDPAWCLTGHGAAISPKSGHPPTPDSGVTSSSSLSCAAPGSPSPLGKERAQS